MYRNRVVCKRLLQKVLVVFQCLYVFFLIVFTLLIGTLEHQYLFYSLCKLKAQEKQKNATAGEARMLLV